MDVTINPAPAAAAIPVARPRLTESGVKSFIAHVGAVAAGVVMAVAASLVFATVAPVAFAYAAAGAFAVGAALAGAKVGDAWWHWSRGEEMDSAATFREHVRSHFEGAAL